MTLYNTQLVIQHTKSDERNLLPRENQSNDIRVRRRLTNILKKLTKHLLKMFFSKLLFDLS